MNVTVFPARASRSRAARLAEVAGLMRVDGSPPRASDLLVFDDETGNQVDLDLRPEHWTCPRSRGHGLRWAWKPRK